MTENLTLRIAQNRVRAYTDESDDLMKRHEEAMECCDCEDLLQIGIDAHKWLRRAEDTMREAVYLGLFEFTHEVKETLDILYAAWLEPCEFAEKWILFLDKREYIPDNLAAFRNACEKVEDTLQHRDWQNLATSTRASSEAEEVW